MWFDVFSCGANGSTVFLFVVQDGLYCPVILLRRTTRCPTKVLQHAEGKRTPCAEAQRNHDHRCVSIYGANALQALGWHMVLVALQESNAIGAHTYSGAGEIAGAGGADNAAEVGCPVGLV